MVSSLVLKPPKLRDGRLSISGTDLYQFLSCRHRNALELSVARGVRERPKCDDPRIETHVELGMGHYREYVLNLKQLGNPSPTSTGSSTLKPPSAGPTKPCGRVDIIVQAGLSQGN